MSKAMNVSEGGVGRISRTSTRPDPAKEVLVKGVVLRTSLHCFAKLRGEAALGTALATCSGELADALAYGRIVAGGWYPISWYRQLLACFAEAGGGDAFIKTLARDATLHDISGVYLPLSRALGKSSVAAVCTKLLSNYFTQVDVTAEEARTNQVMLRLAGCIGFDHNLYLHVLGCAEQLAKANGGRQPQAKIVRGGANMQQFAVVEVKWS